MKNVKKEKKDYRICLKEDKKTGKRIVYVKYKHNDIVGHTLMKSEACLFRKKTAEKLQRRFEKQYEETNIEVSIEKVKSIIEVIKGD